MSTRRFIVRAAVACGVLALGGGAVGQGAAGPGSGAGSAGAAVKVPALPPVLTRHATNHRDWTVVIDLRLNGSQPNAPAGYVDLRQTRRVAFDSATLFFPLTGASAAHETWDDRLTGKLEMDGRVLSAGPRLLTGYPGPARLGAWDGGAASGNALQLHLEIPMTCWETRIDEARAGRIGWPAGAWPEEVAACLVPQVMVESDSAAVRLLVERWMKQAPGGADAKQTAPYVLAKYLAGRVVSHYQPSSGAIESRPRGRNTVRYSGALVSGFALEGAARAAERGRGPVLDMANLLAAVYRAAGIPARVVIGNDQRVEDPRLKKEERKQLAANVRAWVEFCLFDEADNRVEWVPVDVQRQREFSSRAPPLGQRWQFFGHHEDLEFMQPLSFHWLPPTPCMNVGPVALWGWVPKPEDVVAEPDLRIVVRAASRRGDDPKRSTPGPGGAGGR